MDWINEFEHQVQGLITNMGISGVWVNYFRLLVFIIILFIIAVIAFWITKKVVIHYLYKFFEKTSFKWDDLLSETKAMNNLAHIVPAVIVIVLAPIIFSDFKTLLPIVIKLTNVYLVIVSLSLIVAVMKVCEYALSHHPSLEDKPWASYFQLVRIIFYIVAGIIIFSILLNKSPVYFLSVFGAMTAIILLIFKDTILGLVASVQMSTNDMVRVGDWVSMPKFNTDGDVIGINLNTVKIRNWDKTISSVPTYHFITDSFKNWRGMQQTGGRRIKRSIFIDTHSVKLVDDRMKEKFKKFQLITKYIEDKEKEIADFNKKNNIDTSVLINGRQMTNLGVFRIYIDTYLRSTSKIKQDMFIMVRQIATGSKGIPLELYCFTNTVAWAEYEPIQSDIFDHLYAVAHLFELEVFQDPSGLDVVDALNKNAK